VPRPPNPNQPGGISRRWKKLANRRNQGSDDAQTWSSRRRRRRWDVFELFFF
jgi:hypothetical protein